LSPIARFVSMSVQCRSRFQCETSEGTHVPRPHEIRGAADVQWHSTALRLLTGLVLALTACHRTTKADVEPKISFTQVPEWSSGAQNDRDVIEGKVSGSKQGQHVVV